MANIKIYDEEDDINEDMIFDSDNVVDKVEQTPVTTKEEESEDDFNDSDYKVSSISHSFLKIECNIKTESSKTPIKFKYQGEMYKGIVLKKMNNDNYIFLVQKTGKGIKDKSKFMKKIYIPDATLV